MNIPINEHDHKLQTISKDDIVGSILLAYVLCHIMRETDYNKKNIITNDDKINTNKVNDDMIIHIEI